MFGFFKNVRWSLLFIGIFTIAIGVAMVMYPDTATDTIVKIFGGMMAASGLFSILGYIIDRARGRNAFTSLLVGVFMLIVGAIFYFKPASFVEFLGNIFAAAVLVLGINLIAEAISSKKYETSHWGQTFLMGLICIVLAAIIFINPFAEFRALMILTGVALIITGLLNIFVSGRIGLAAHRFNKAVKAVEAGLSEDADIRMVLKEPTEEEIIGETNDDTADEPTNEPTNDTTYKTTDKTMDQATNETITRDVDAHVIPENLSDIKIDFSEK